MHDLIAAFCFADINFKSNSLFCAPGSKSDDLTDEKFKFNE